jgi:hypothetical protein
MKEPKKLTPEEICQLEFHPLANLFPLLEGKELDELANDIERNGLNEEIVLFQGKILDGRNRYNACRRLGLGLGTGERAGWYPFVLFKNPRPDSGTLTEAATAFVITKNIVRRNLTPDQRAMLAAELYAKLPKRAHGGDRKSSSWTSELDNSPSAGRQKSTVASQMGVSTKHVERAAALQKKDAEKAAEVQSGTKTMAQAEQELKQKPQVLKFPQPPKEPNKQAETAVGEINRLHREICAAEKLNDEVQKLNEKLKSGPLSTEEQKRLEECGAIMERRLAEIKSQPTLQTEVPAPSKKNKRPRPPSLGERFTEAAHDVLDDISNLRESWEKLCGVREELDDICGIDLDGFDELDLDTFESAAEECLKVEIDALIEALNQEEKED